MLSLQERMNFKVDENWKEKHFPWEDAIFTEATEAFNHTNWPWWKKEGTEINMPQLKLELVDIAHFLFSYLIEQDDLDISALLNMVTETVESTAKELEAMGNCIELEANRPELIKKSLKRLISVSVRERDNGLRWDDIIIYFVLCMYTVGMDWPDLYKMYVGKNTLNQFRQAKGYKTDTKAYKDKWSALTGREDNVYLELLLNSLDPSSDTFVLDINNALEAKFNEVT